MTDVETTLRDLLTGGPRPSREVLAAMTERGMTAKQVRRARERLCIAVVRSGNGASTRSIWALPAETQSDRASPTEPGIGRSATAWQLRKAKVSCSLRLVPSPRPNALLAEKLARVARRVVVFMARGLDQAQANAVATDLVLQRDRPGIRAGSCVECQCYTGPSACSSAQFTGGPRDAGQVWACQWRRHDAP